MAATSRGAIVPLSFGTTAISGYVVESTSSNQTGETAEVTDEDGDVVYQRSGFGLKTEVSLEVIPKTATTAPVPGDAFTYDGSSKIVIGSISIKKGNKDFEKWSITGVRFPDVTIT